MHCTLLRVNLVIALQLGFNWVSVNEKKIN